MREEGKRLEEAEENVDKIQCSVAQAEKELEDCVRSQSVGSKKRRLTDLLRSATQALRTGSRQIETGQRELLDIVLPPEEELREEDPASDQDLPLTTELAKRSTSLPVCKHRRRGEESLLARAEFILLHLERNSQNSPREAQTVAVKCKAEAELGRSRSGKAEKPVGSCSESSESSVKLEKSLGNTAGKLMQSLRKGREKGGRSQGRIGGKAKRMLDKTPQHGEKRKTSEST